MRVVEKTAKTVEEAITACMEELEGIKKEQVKIEILEEPGKRGFLGLFGSKLARVKVSFEDNPGVLAQIFLRDLTKAIGVEAEFEVFYRENNILINITGNDLGILIGRRGETLEAIQFLTNLSIAKKISDRTRIMIDVEGYRKRREETLIKLAKRLAEKVKKTGNRVVLEPMSPQERRIIHTALQNEWKVVTFSEGEEPHRRIVISMRKNQREMKEVSYT